MPFLLIAATWLRRLASAIPLYAYALAGLCLALAWSHHSARAWHHRYDVAQASIDALGKAQRAANTVAALNKVRVETAQTAITKESDNDTKAKLGAVAADYAALRLRYAALARHPGPGAVSGVPGGSVSTDGTVSCDAAIPAPQLIDFAEQGDVWRARLVEVQAWYAAQAAVDRTPTP